MLTNTTIQSITNNNLWLMRLIELYQYNLIRRAVKVTANNMRKLDVREYVTGAETIANSLYIEFAGCSDPSDGDLLVTRKIQKALKAIGMSLYDHIIVSKANYYSFNEEDVLSSMQKKEIKTLPHLQVKDRS